MKQILACSLFFIGSLALAQTSLQGSIKDDNGEPVPGLKVEFHSVEFETLHLIHFPKFNKINHWSTLKVEILAGRKFGGFGGFVENPPN